MFAFRLSFVLALFASLFVTNTSNAEIIIVDVEIMRVDGTDETFEAGYVIIEDDLMYLTTEQEEIIIEDTTILIAIDLVVTTCSSPDIRFTMTESGGETSVTVTVRDDVGNIIITDDLG